MTSEDWEAVVIIGGIPVCLLGFFLIIVLGYRERHEPTSKPAQDRARQIDPKAQCLEHGDAMICVAHARWYLCDTRGCAPIMEAPPR